MKLLVTGGAGFIGSNFIRYILKRHPTYKIINYDKLTYAGNLDNVADVELNPNYRFVKGDIADSQRVSDLIKTFKISHIVNFAAETHVDRSIAGPEAFIETNVLGTQVLLDAALKRGIKRFHHISCYDTQTRAFTNSGLKRYDEIKKGDLVLSLNPETGDVEWKPVEKVIVQNYKGEMIEMKSRVVDFLVTPNHRMLFQAKKSKKLVYKTAEDLKKQSINKLPKFYHWKGRVPKMVKQFKNAEDFMYLLGIFIGDGFTAYQEKKVVNKTGLSKLEYLKKARNALGQFTTVGKIGSKKFTIMKSWRIFLDIPEKDSCRKKCEAVLDNLDIKWHAQKGKSGEHLYFTSQKFTRIFRQCGRGAKNKKIPQWALNSPPELLRPLLEGLLDSDGSNRRIFYTSSQRLVYQFMELCVKLGLSPTMARRYTASQIGSRKINSYSFLISIGTQWRIVRKEIIKSRNYTGKVWCLKVKDNRNFLIERNGRTAFCGNTDEVFGALSLDNEDKFTEETRYDPRSPYSASKAASDHLVRSYHETYGLPVSITNTSNNFGPFMHPEKFLSRAITNLINGEKIPVYGDGKYVRDWLYVEDHCRAIDLILHQKKAGETYLVGGLTDDINNLEVAKKLLKIFRKDASWIEFVADRPGHDRRYAIDWSKIKNELGWEPKYDFDTWLRKTVDWYKENEWWWRPLKKEAENFYQIQKEKKGADDFTKFIKETSIPGLLVLEMPTYKDKRGFFREISRLNALEKITGTKFELKQWNHSLSKPGVIRALHAENWNKLVYPITGRAFTAIVDIRPESPTFGKVETFQFKEGDCKALFIPKGLANSICVNGNKPAHYLYLVDAYYDGGDVKAVAWDDPDLAIKWPVKKPIISKRDQENPSLRELFPDKFKDK